MTPMATPIPPPADVPLFERGLWNRAWFIVLLCLAFAAVDWEKVSLSVFPFVFVFPVMLAAWNRSLRFAVVCTLGLALTRLARQFVFDEHPDSVDEVVAVLAKFFVLLLVAILTNLLGQQARQLRHRVRALEGMLPICSYCKCIRDDQDNWVQLERYISGHSQAQFTHGLCPECAERHYSDFLPPKKTG